MGVIGSACVTSLEISESITSPEWRQRCENDTNLHRIMCKIIIFKSGELQDHYIRETIITSGRRGIVIYDSREQSYNSYGAGNIGLLTIIQ